MDKLTIDVVLTRRGENIIMIIGNVEQDITESYNARVSFVIDITLVLMKKFDATRYWIASDWAEEREALEAMARKRL